MGPNGTTLFEDKLDVDLTRSSIGIAILRYWNGTNVMINEISEEEAET